MKIIKKQRARIHRLLELSTGHLPLALRNSFAGDMSEAWRDTTVWPIEFGFLAWVPSLDLVEEMEMELPNAIAVVFAYARGCGCEYVFFDRDGDRNPQLDWYEE